MATFKQKEAFKKISENLGNVSKTMREVGYSDITAATPSNLTNSKGWKELMDTYLPEEDLIKVHKEGLSCTKKIVIDGELIEVDDYPTRHRYLEVGYKLRGRLSIKENEEKTPLININIANILEKAYGKGQARRNLSA